ncbi:MAG: imidazole glycerol phosphate synthase subunit HisH [Actinomycetota bacterium]|nr:imidazole glycerol phosphate synthase subunit HisH [Actinomycetota bacterium]
MIAVLDYGIGNLRSAEKALQRVGGDARLVDRAQDAPGAVGVVLPGVGAFGACARALRSSGLEEVARAALASGVPFLGVCVGFQLLFEGSEEDPREPGLGILAGVVRRVRGGLKLPQMQWNRTTPVPGGPHALLPEERWFYYVHSYAPVPEGEGRAWVAATCDYGGEVVAAVEGPGCWATQFHPEKSGAAGLELLARFVATCDGRTTVG